MWVFGYGSLLWYQDFPHTMSKPGIVKGFSRRFWQKSPDHRGTPESPGRTVTLVPEEGGVVWGIAFKVPDDQVISTKAYLDHREKAGYECVTVSFEPDDKSLECIQVEVYMSIDATNEHHAGPAEIEEIANIIIRSRGPSGSNIEYALRIARILRENAPHVPDEHVFALERKILELSNATGLGKEIISKLGYP